MLEIVSANIEGIKGNIQCLKELPFESNILYHWLHRYEINLIGKIVLDNGFNIPWFDNNIIDEENHNRRETCNVKTKSKNDFASNKNKHENIGKDSGNWNMYRKMFIFIK